jgi:tetratricopeptide (TPR) repeat protein
MSQCAQLGCQSAAKSSCSGCGIEKYCGSICQKLDWKEHKFICATLKRLPKQLEPYPEVFQVIKNIMNGPEKFRNNTRVLGHLVSCAEFQFGDRIRGKSYRERELGERIPNWNVEILIICEASLRIASLFFNDDTLDLIVKDDMAIPHLEKVLKILKPWSILIDLNDTSHSENLEQDQIHHIFRLLCGAHRQMGIIYSQQLKYDLSEYHCERCLAYGKRFEGTEEEKACLLGAAYRAYCRLRNIQQNYTAGVIFAEEAYNCYAMVYNPVHPEVQSASGCLIEALIFKGDYDKAEIFAQMTLDSLKDKANGLNQDSDQVAEGYYNLGKIIYRQDRDLVKAVSLTREAHRIRIQLYGNNHYKVGLTSCLLATILSKQGKFNFLCTTLYFFPFFQGLPF